MPSRAVRPAARRSFSARSLPHGPAHDRHAGVAAWDSDWDPTIADLLKAQGYATGQFGKNHLGDRDEHLPTVHGFDEFLGNLYHLNAEEEPETYDYPKDPEFRKKYGPRGVHPHEGDGKGGQTIEDTGPLTHERMKTVDQEIYAGAHEVHRPGAQGRQAVLRLVQHHPHARLDAPLKEAEGETGIGLYPDGMVEHDKMVGELLKKLDDMGIADDTIVIYSTDNGAETVTWPDGGTTPYHGEKATTWEGGFRVPCVDSLAGHDQARHAVNDIMSQEDWLPTLLAAAGEPDIVAKLEKGYKVGGKTFKVHPDGYDFLPYFKGEAKKGPREEIYYFGQDGDLNAVRWNDWKVHFAVQNGNIATATRDVPGWPVIVNLRADPFEKAPHESGLYLRWYADNIWLFVPVQQKLRTFLMSLPEYPFQQGSSLNAANINYDSLKAMMAMKRLEQLETMASPHN